MSITITNGFDATFSYNTPVCQSSGNEFPTFSPGASAGVFSSTLGLVFVNTSTGEIDLAASTPNTYTITNFIAASGGCASATYSTTLTIDLPATVNAGADASICSGVNATLSGSIGGSASSATWSGGLGTFSPNNSTLNATYTPDPSETLVTLFLTTDSPANSCSAVTDTVVITIKPLPVAPTASGATICSGTSATITATAPGGSYQWFANPTGGSSLFNGASFNTPILVATTTYYVQTTVNGCSSSSRTPVTVTVTPIDDPSFNYSPSTYCVSGGNATPTITGGSTGTFTSTPSGLVFANTSTGEIDVASTTLGTYTITFITDGACPDSATFDVTITNAPDATFSYNNPYCSSGSNPTPTFPIGASAGEFTALPAGLVFVNTNTGLVNLSASTPGIYTVTNEIIAAGGCASAIYSDTIEILAAPVVDVGLDASICASDAQLTLNGSVNNAGGMVWSTSGDGTFSPDSTSSTVDFLAGSSDINNGAATIYLTSTQNGVCSAVTDSIIITIDQAPIVDAGLDLTACVGDNVTLSGSIGGSASSATWSGGLGTFSPNNTDLNATYTPDPSETLVTLFLTTDDPSGSCAAIVDTVTITINPLPAAPTASDDTICEGTSTTLTATAPGGSYQWFSNSTGGSSLFNGAVFNTPVLTTTTIYYLQTTVSGCSSDTRTPVTVTINPTDDPSFNYSPSTYCLSGGNATPTITGGATGTFTASPSGLVFADSSTGEIDVIATTLGTYTVTFTTNGQCPDSATFDVTITNAPDATFSYNNPYCASGSNPFPTFPIGASAGVFTAIPAGLVFVNANTGQVNLSASTPGIYTVTNDIVAGGGCVQAIYSDTIEILPAPTVDAGVDTSICANNTQIDLSGMVTNAGGMAWSTSGDGAFTPDTTSANVTYNAGTNDITNGSTTIYLTTTQNGVCSAVMDSIIITITPAPIVDAGNNILICDGILSTTLNGSVSGGASSGMWTGLGTGTFSPDNTTLNASYTLSLLDSANGGVQLILESTNNGGCLVVYDTLNIFLSSPATAFAGIDTTVCVNNSLVQLGGTITGGTGEGIWSSLGGGTFTPTASDLNASYQLDSTDIANGFVTLILDAVNSCVPASDTVVITINPGPIVDAGNNITICKAESASLNGSISFADGGQWTSNGTGTFIPNDTTLNATYVPSSADISLGTLELVLTSSGNGTCNAVSDTLMLSFSESPVAIFSTTGSCEGTVVQFNDSSTITTGTITDYAWDFGNGDTSSVQNPTSIYTNAGSYTVTLIITSNSGCNDTVSNVITINPLPTALFSYLSTCTTDTVLFTDNSTVTTGSITQWDWDFGDLTTSTLQNPSHGFGIIDTFSVTLTVTSDLGCTANITQDVIVAPQPIVDFGYAINCQNSTVTYTDSSSAAAGDVIVAYLWTFGNGNTSILQNPLPETYASGSYLVQLQITTQGGCTAIDTATINIAATPTAAYIPQGGQFNLNEVINFTNQSQNAVSYHWNFGNNNDTSNVLNPSYGYATNGTYTVTLISSAGGCADTISYDFEIIGTPVRPVVVPTAFSPNGDGINDVFSILGGPFKTYQLTVYNEWGQEIFTSNEQIEGWDGSYKGNNQPTGSYVYVFNGITIVDEIIKLHGEIAIVK
jgi:gliding motility-associated-like protein